jgi:hypothetical protein
MRRTGAWRFICADRCIRPRRLRALAELDGPQIIAARLDGIHAATKTLLTPLPRSLGAETIPSTRPEKLDKVRRGCDRFGRGVPL